MDRTFSLELKFLNENAEIIAKDRIHRIVLDALPAENTTKSFSSVLLALHNVKTSPLCMACGPAVIAEVEGVHSLVASIDEGTGIEARDVSNFSEFYKTVMARLQFFYQRIETGPGADVCKRTLYGRPAIMDLYATILETKKSQGQVSMKNLQPLRSFKWLLSPEQLIQSAAWIQDATVTHAAMLTRKALGDKADGEGTSSDNKGGAIVPATAYLAASSGANKKKSKTDGETIGGAQKKDLMHFFTGKRK